jgi:signal transduction histidine kinase/HAMP domain-containing protein
MTRLGRGLVGRLVVTMILVATLAAVVGTLLLRGAALSAARDNALASKAIVAQELATRLDSRLANAEDTLRIVASHGQVAEVSPAAAERLRAILRSSLTYDELVLYDADGNAVTAAANAFEAGLVDYPARDDIAPRATTVGFVGIDESFPPELEIAVPIQDPPGSPVGFLLARLPLEAIALPVQHHDAASGATRFLINEEGAVLVHPERDRMLERAQFPVDQLAGGSGIVEVDGERYIAALAPARSIGGSVVVTQREALALAPVQQQMIELAAILVAVLGATTLAVSVAGGRMLRPLERLSDAAARLAAGERRVRVGERGTGEVALLSQEFDRMAAALDQRETQLAELQRLALLVSASVDRDGLADDLVRGALTLLEAETCVFLTSDGEERSEIAGLAGRPLDGSQVRELVEPADAGGADAHVLVAPVTTLAGTSIGELIAVRPQEGFDDDERTLAEAYAAFAAVALDNARRLQLEQALVHELQEGMERRRMLISGVTHEFRTPLTCIEGFSSELLEHDRDYTEEEREGLLQKIRAHAEELDHLVTQLLEFAATERGRAAPDPSTVRLDTVVAQEIASLSALLGDRPVRVDVPEITVVADSQLVRRVLSNLLSNAAKYSPPGTPITIRAEPEGNSIRVDVVDQGIGMTPEELESAFQPFWRAPGVLNERGTGLGLALVSEYVRIMNGTLRANSTPGVGSVFSFTLPVRVRELQP